MSPFRQPMLLAATCLLALCVSTLGTPPSAPKKRAFEAYPLVRTRNIFDPDRQPGVSSASGPVQPVTPSSASSNNDFAALNGTMITAEKSLAFFSGSRPEFNKVLAAGSMIAGAKLIKITPDSIEVDRNGTRTVIAVGQTVPLNASSAPTAAPTTAPAPSSTDTSASPAPSSGSDREAVMRRMMEKRQQELK